MTWLRLDDGFVTNPKVTMLTLKEFKLWVSILCYCSRNDDPTVDNATIRALKGLKSDHVLTFFRVGLLDQSGSVYEVHDWADYRPKDSTGAERQARWRSRQASEDRYSTVTPTVTEPLLARAIPDPVTLKPKTLRSGRSPEGERGAA